MHIHTPRDKPTHPKVATKFTVGQPITKAFAGQISAITTSLMFSEIHTSAMGTQCFSLKLRLCLAFPGFPTMRRSLKRNIYLRLLSELGCSKRERYVSTFGMICFCYRAGIPKQMSLVLRGDTSLTTSAGHCLHFHQTHQPFDCS